MFDETPLPYLTQLSPNVRRLINTGIQSDWLYLFCYFPPDDEDLAVTRARYLQRLIAHYRDQGLYTVTVLQSEGGIVEANPYGRTLHDAQLDLHRGGHISPGHHHGGLLVLNRQYQIEFRTTSLSSDDELRQLVEKYAIQHISYSFSPSQLTNRLRVGIPLPPLRLRSISSGHPILLDSSDESNANRALVFLAAECPICELPNRIDPIRRALEDWKKTSPIARFMIIFPDVYSRFDLVRALSDSLSVDTFSGDLSPLFGDDVGTRHGDLSAPLVVYTDHAGLVAAISNLGVS